MKNTENLVVKADLVRRIESAFPIGGPFSKEEITECECEDCLELREQFQGHTSTSLPAEIIERFYSDLSLLSPGAYRALLRSYLLHAIESPDDLGGANQVLEFATYNLQVIKEGAYMCQWWHDRVDGFSPKQAQAIAAFLRYAVSRDDYLLEAKELEDALAFWEAKGADA